jgi:hypothetical protein
MPQAEPSEISAGDTVEFVIMEDDFPATNGWSMLWSLRSPDDKIDVPSVPDGNNHTFTLLSTLSADLEAGPFAYGLYFIGTDGNGNPTRFTYRLGRIDVKPDLQTLDVTQTDPRSWAEQMLALIKNVIAGRIPADVESYQIAGRSVTSMRSADLIKWHDYFSRLVSRERMTTAIQKGYTGKKNIGVTFLRPSAVYAPYRGFGQTGGRGAYGAGIVFP